MVQPQLDFLGNFLTQFTQCITYFVFVSAVLHYKIKQCCKFTIRHSSSSKKQLTYIPILQIQGCTTLYTLGMIYCHFLSHRYLCLRKLTLIHHPSSCYSVAYRKIVYGSISAPTARRRTTTIYTHKFEVEQCVHRLILLFSWQTHKNTIVYNRHTGIRRHT